MTKLSFAFVLIALLFLNQGTLCQTKSTKESKRKQPTLASGYDYDARAFLSETQIISFNRVYPEFDSVKAIKDWQWKDVDPLGLFTPAENRKRRREQFLFDYAPDAMSTTDGYPNEEQKAFEPILQRNYPGSEILMSGRVLKLKIQYTPSYEDSLPKWNLLQKVSDLGLQWAQVGGSDLVIYNGVILLASYKSGYVSLVNGYIDNPSVRKVRSPK